MSFDTLPLDDPESLAEQLLDAAAVGQFAEALTEATGRLEAEANNLDPEQTLRLRVLFFDLAMVSTTDWRLQGQTAIELVGALEGDTWNAVLGTGRIDDLRRLTDEPEIGLELIELLSYAPDTDIHDFAASQLEALGMQRVLEGTDARSIERLLHASGASDAAYRLEAARKLRESAGRPVRSRAAEPELPFRLVAIAGGHTQLRAAAASVLEPYGVSVVPIPSSQEAVRRERGILQALQGCDVAMILVRQITHSTSDQVRKAAERLGIPVFFSNAASAVAIERQLLERSRPS